MSLDLLERTSVLYKPMWGAGGGGQQSGSSTAPTNTPDTLRSADSVEIILGLGEGKWKGLVNGSKSYYVGDTVLQNADNTFNFEYFELEIRPGLPENLADYLIPKLGGTSNNIPVNTILSYNVPIVRQMSENQIDAIDLRFNVNQLFRQDNNGIYTTELDLVVEIKKNTETIWLPAFGNATLPIKGKATSTYIKELRIPVARTDDFYQIRVTKLTTNTDSTHASDVTWDSIQMINMDLKKYADTATARIFAKATNQFSSIPQMSGIFDMREIRIPSNYDPVTRTSTGVWDGTFNVAWTDNPAWIVFDFVTNSRFGMSAAAPLNMDKYEVAAIAEWCDTPVDNGAGGFRPRYTFNALITEPTNALEMARYIAGTFNATLFDDNNGTIIMRCDMNQDATHLFTPEMVGEDGFVYSFTDINSRANDLTVSFKDPDLLYDENRVRCFDQDHINEFGRVPLDFIAVGCNNQAEAKARGNYKLLTATTETMLVSFSTNRVGAVVEPYEVILIADPVNGYALTGRIKSLNPARTQVNLRDALHLEVGVDYYMQLRIAGGLSTTNYTVSVPSTGSVKQFNVSPALPADLPEYCSFYLAQDPGVGIGSPKPFRVMGVEEMDGSPDNIKITAIELNRNKFTDAETGIITAPTQYSGIGDPNSIPGPTNVEFAERFNLIGNEVWTIITATLPRDQYRYYTGDFDVYSRQLDTNNGDEPIGSFEKRTVLYGDTIVNHPEGKWEFKILPRNSFGQTPPIGSVLSWVHIVSSASAVGIPPEPVESLAYQLTATGFIARWNPPTGQETVIHHYLVKEGLTEDIATVIADNIKDPILVVDPMTKRDYHLWIYAVSTAGVLSSSADIVITNYKPAVPTNIRVEVGYETLMVFFDRDTEVDLVGSRIRYRIVGQSSYTDMNPNGLLDSVLPDTAYEFQVAAQDALTLLLNDEVWSSPYSVRTNDTVGVAKGIDDVQASTTQNLVRNGSFERDDQYWTFDSATIITDATAPYVDNVLLTSKILKLGDGSASVASAVSDKFVVRANQQYAIGADFRADVTHPGEAHIFTLRVYNSGNVLLGEYTEETGKIFVDPSEISSSTFTRLTSTFLIPSGGVYAEVFLQARGTGILYVDGVQAQRGAVATAFNPHVAEELSAADLNVISNPDNTPPGMPTTLSASGAFRNINLLWSAPSDADIDHYDVFRATTNVLSSASLVGSPIATVFSDSAVITGQTYYYWVRAVDRSGNLGPFTPSSSATTIQLAAADFANLTIVNAMIADATIDDAKIANLSVSKLIAGTITAGQINLGNDRFRLDSSLRRLTVVDDINIARVLLGRLGNNPQDYGLQVYDSTGKLILGADGLGVAVVGSGNLANGSVTGDKIVANAISADKIAANSITTDKLVTNSITTAKIAAGAVTADKISVATLSAIAADVGTLSAGLITATGQEATNYWNLSTGAFSVGKADGSTYMRYNPTTGAVEIQGTITVTNTPPVNWTDINGRPTTLGDLDPDQDAKLDGIEAGADVTGSNTSANTAAVGSLTTAQAVAKILDPAATINTNTTTIDGGKITTGTITANKISVGTLSALTANIGYVTSGAIGNANGSVFMNLDATGSQDFLNCNGAFKVTADGAVTMTSGTISGDLLVDGTITAGKIAGNAISDFGVATNGITITVNTNEKLLFWVNYFLSNKPISPSLNQFIDGTALSTNVGTSGQPSLIDNWGSGFGSMIVTIAPGTYTFRVFWHCNPNGNLNPQWAWYHYPSVPVNILGGSSPFYNIMYLKLKK